MLLTGCNNNESSITTVNATIDGKTVDSTTLALNSIMSYEFTVQSSEQVGTVMLVKNVDGLETNVPVISYASGNTAKIDGTVLVNSGMSLTLKVYGRSADEIMASKTIKVKLFATTNVVTNIAQTSATSGGFLADNGENVTSRGVCWDTLPNPTTDLNTKTNDGTGSGAFVSSITKLLPGTTYYVRAYGVVSEGVLYGNQQTFTTATPPLAAVLNGGFESPAISGFSQSVTIANWTGDAGIEHNGSAFGAAFAPEGTQAALFQGVHSISQTIDFTGFAGNYALSCWGAQRGSQSQTFVLYFDNVVIGNFQPASSKFEYFASKTFAATVGIHTITISATNGSGDNTGFIDNIMLEYRR